VVSRQWGFTKFTREDYVAWKQEGRLVHDGVNAKLLDNHDRMDKRKPNQLFMAPARIYKVACKPAEEEEA